MARTGDKPIAQVAKELQALIAGERDPNVLADLARARMRAKLPELRLSPAAPSAVHQRAVAATGQRRTKLNTYPRRPSTDYATSL